MEISNVVSAVYFDSPIDTSALAEKYGSVFYRTKSFNAINLRGDEKSYCQLFNSGRAIINGGKSVKEAAMLADMYECLLKILGVKGCIVRRDIVNIVATYQYGKRIKLCDLASHLVRKNKGKNKLFYEPELFPAVKFRFDDIKVTVNVFHTGKFVILGAKTVIDIEESVRRTITTIQDAKNSG